MRGWLLTVGLCAILVLAAPACVASSDPFLPPKPEELAMRSVPGYPGAPAVVLYREQIDNSLSRTVTVYERIKVLNEEGKEYANIELGYLRSSFFGGAPTYDSSVKEIEGRTIHADGTMVLFTAKPYEKTAAKFQGEAVKEKVFTLPDVQVGSVLEFRYTKQYETLMIPDWIVQGDLYVKAAHYRWVEGGMASFYSTSSFPILPPGVQLIHTAPPWPASRWLWLLTALTLLVLLVHGYHPLAEDGGLYVAGILWKLDPTLFPQYTSFVTEHLGFSIFAPFIAALVRHTHVPLPWVLFLSYLLSIGLTLFAARQVLRRVIDSEFARLAGVALLAAWWTLPVAATSLMLMDPYLTARSFSLPLSLLAIAFALDDWHRRPRSAFTCTACLLLAFLFHPLMAAYTLALVILLRIVRRRRTLPLLVLLTAFVLAVALLVQIHAPPESSALRAAEITRYYWFLSQWHWYELLGIIAPLILFALLRSRRRIAFLPATTTLCRACIALGLIATLVALIFARENLATHLIARLQPLRVFVLLYAIMAMLLGAALQRLCFTTRPHVLALRTTLRAFPIAALAAFAGVMFTAQRASFPASQHLELPWRIAQNPNAWTQAFLWARDHTPRNALFAIDADYITTPGEDAQAFRAIAQRSVLPDHSKDGGEAAITPALADAWLLGVTAQTNLSALSDSARDARLRSLGVNWIVLRAATPTQHACPYTNSVVKVCELNP